MLCMVRPSLVRYRFDKDELRRFHTALRLPDFIHTSNGGRQPSEKALLVLLARYTMCERRLTDMEARSGLEYSQISRLFNATLECMDETKALPLLLTNGLAAFVERFELYNTKILDKYRALNGVAVVPPMWTSVCGFIDGKRLKIARPSNADVQYATYSRYITCNSMHSLLAVLPDGMVPLLTPGCGGRRHEAMLQRINQINDRMVAAQAGKPRLLGLATDKGFYREACIHPMPRGANLPPALMLASAQMSPLRWINEAAIGRVSNEWPLVDSKKLSKTGAVNVSRLYRVAVFLSNCRTCLRGSAASQFFDCRPPSIEEYLGCV